MNQYSDEQLDQMTGMSNSGFTRFKVISVDNGSDVAGTGATGFFVEKVFNDETRETERIPMGENITGVILAYKAQLVHKDSKALVRTEEFDPGATKAPIKIYPLKDGKVIKSVKTGDVIFTTKTYKEIQTAKLLPAMTLEGPIDVPYTYFMFAYVAVGTDIIKLKFSGSGRGNFFDYSKKVGAMGAKLYNVNTLFSTYIDPEYGKYTVKFDVELNKKGVPTPVDADMVRMLRVQVANNIQSFSGRQIEGPAPVPQIDESYGPEDEQPSYEDPDEVQLSDIPSTL